MDSDSGQFRARYPRGIPYIIVYTYTECHRRSARHCIVVRISLPRAVDNAPNASFAKRATKGDGKESYVCKTTRTMVTTDIFEMEDARWKVSFCRGELYS